MYLVPECRACALAMDLVFNYPENVLQVIMGGMEDLPMSSNQPLYNQFDRKQKSGTLLYMI